MLLKSVYDLIGAFVIGAGEHLVTIGTVEKQHYSISLLQLLKLAGEFVNLVGDFQVVGVDIIRAIRASTPSRVIGRNWPR
jgi:hypothetical protein